MQSEEEAAVECLQQCAMALADVNRALADKAGRCAVSLEEKLAVSNILADFVSRPAPLTAQVNEG